MGCGGQPLIRVVLLQHWAHLLCGGLPLGFAIGHVPLVCQCDHALVPAAADDLHMVTSCANFRLQCSEKSMVVRV